MLSKEKESKTDFLNNFYITPNNFPKKKSETNRDKKRLNQKTNPNFQKITGSGNINTLGSQSIVVFKKTSNKKNIIDINHNSKNNQNQNAGYISDGGLSQKLQKFNNNTNVNAYSNDNNIYFNNYKSERNQPIPNNKNYKNIYNNEQINSTNTITRKLKEQQFSKTVRDFNKRPAIPKNEKIKDENTNTKNSKKLKNKSVNQNINSNPGNFTHNKNNKHIKKINSEDSKNQEEKKILVMNKLVEAGVVSEINKLNKKRKITQKDIKDIRKREVLENNGLPIDFSGDEEEKKDDSKNNTNNTNNKEEKENSKNQEHNNNTNNMGKKLMSKTTRGFYPKMNNYMFSLDDNNNEEKASLRAKKLKPSVNQFEYINRINNEKKKLNFNSELSPHRVAGLPKRQTKSVNMELNDSFRRKTSRDNDNNKDNKNAKLKNKSYNNEINKKSIEDYEDEFPFAHRKNQRSTEEIKKFVKQKRIKSKKEEDDKVFEKNKKLFLLFKNLYNLNMKDFSKPNPTVTNDHFFMKSPPLQSSATTFVRGKAVMPSKNNINYNNINKNDNNINNNNNTNGSSNSNSNNNLRKKKEINQYYIGNDSTIKNNNSTLIDPNEYYLNVLESQQLFVNSGLNKIENDIDTSEENNNNSNELNVSKEQIQKIIRTNSSDKKSNLVLDTNEYDDLKKKIGNTLKRAGKMFSNKDKDNDTTEDNKTKSEISKSTEKKKDKDKDKEKENESSNKKNHPKSPEINIESSNVEQQKIVNSETENVTKEKNLPSLSHEYTTNSNPNKKVEIAIEPRLVLNLVEIIKFIIQRKVFVLLYESYINKAIYQQYNIAFAYFVAVCKHYPFRKLEEYANYITYKYAFRHLFKPFMRKAFRKFIKIIFTKKKIEFLALFLTKFYKFKIFSKIFIFANIRKKILENAKKIKSFVSLITNPYLKSNFAQLKNRTKKPKEEKLEKKFEDNIKNNKINNPIEIKEDIKVNNHIQVKEDIKDNNNNTNNQNKIESHFNKIDNPKKIENKNDEDSVNLSDSIKNHRRKNDNSLKMNSYLYESFGSDSKSISLEPNSEDNDKLHQLKMMLLIKNNLDYEDNLPDRDSDSNSNSLNNSASQKKFLNKKLINEQINAKINISDDEELKPEIRKDRILLDKIKMDDLNKEKSIEIDISADNDKNNEIEWGYNINSLNSQGNKESNDNKENNKLVKNEKSLDNEDFVDDEYNDFENELNSENEDKVRIKTNNDIEKEEVKIEKPKKEVKDNNKEKEVIKEDIKEDVKEDIKEEKNDIDIIKSDSKPDKSRNLKQDENQDIKVITEIKKADDNKDSKDKKEKDNKEKDKKEKEKDKEKENERLRELFSKKMKEVENPEKLADDLVKDVLDKLLTTEIKSPKKKLVPTKKFKFDKFEKMNSLNNSLNNSYGSAGNSHDHLSKEFGINGLSQLSLADELLSLNDSIMSNYSAYSVFNKTIKDKKKEQTLNLYFHVIAPKLIKLIHKEIIDKYPQIYENISTPMKNNSEKLMMSLALQDADLLRDNYKTTKNLVSISKILDKEKMLKAFEPINKKIRSRDNLTSDNFYDKMLNDCIIETAIEIINKERLYGKNGEPLKWSSRTHELAFKYKKDDPKKLADFVCKRLYSGLHKKVGLISDNFETMAPEQLNFERDKRLTSIIKRDLDEYEYQWNNLEMEETQLKVDNAELIMDQLYNEVIEILEHIQYSRIRPDLYQNKSIYACDEIPKLDFQLTTTEEATVPEGNENNDIINV